MKVAMKKRKQINKISNKYFDKVDSDLYNNNLHFISDYLQYILYVEISSCDKIVDQMCLYIEESSYGSFKK